MNINYDNIHQAIAALNQCAKENENRQTDTGAVRVSDLCTDVAYFLCKVRQDHKQWQDFKWHSQLEKPEPDSYIIAAEDLGAGTYEYIAGTYIDDSEPWISNGQHCRMWHCIDRWCYAEDMNKTVPKVKKKED